MVRRVVAAIAVGAVLSGCAHVHRIDPVASTPQRESLNLALQGRRVSMELVSTEQRPFGATLRAERVRVAADSTSLTLLRGAKRDSTLSTSAISSITITSRLRGALHGLGLGFAVGATIGAVIGVGEAGEGNDFSTGESVGFGVVVLGILGSAPGLVIGAIVGAREVYDFAFTGTEAKMPARQQGS